MIKAWHKVHMVFSVFYNSLNDSFSPRGIFDDTIMHSSLCFVCLFMQSNPNIRYHIYDTVPADYYSARG